MKKHTVAIVLIALTIPLFAFEPRQLGHLGISRTALQSITRQVEEETLRFSDRAIAQIEIANKDTDCGGKAACFCRSCWADAAAHFDNEDFLNATSRLTDLKEKIIAKITADSPNGAAAREELGKALHAIQDYYSHSNWVEMGFLTIDGRLGDVAFDHTTAAGAPPVASPTTQVCPNNPYTLEGEGLDKLTTGYFRVDDLCVNEGSLPAGKCIHGDFAIDGCGEQGISKDHPGRDGFDTARVLAISASMDFVNQILDDPRVAGNARAIGALMDVRATFAVVIDDSTSATLLSLHKSRLGAIVNSVAGSADAPARYVLVSFSDSHVSPALVTANASQFLDALNALQPRQPLQCPSRAMEALQRAVAASQIASPVFLIARSDTAADADKLDPVMGSARAKGIRISALIYGDTCDSNQISPHYERVAAQTRGHRLFYFTSGELAPLIAPQLASDVGDALWETGSVNGDVREYSLFLDSSLESLTFFVVFPPLDTFDTATLIRPSGAPVQLNDPDVEFGELGFWDRAAITVHSPQPGLWRLQVSGTGTFAVEALGKTSLRLDRFEFVTLTGRPGHEGLFPIQGQPVVGSSAAGPASASAATHTVLASLLGGFETASFRLADLEGNTLQELNLAQGHPDAAQDEFVGTVELPAGPFQVIVAGQMPDGTLYERVFPATFRAQSIEVTHAITFDTVPAGTVADLPFTVQNFGPTGEFGVTGSDSQGFLDAEPILLTLESGQATEVHIHLTVPVETPEGTEIMVALSATSTVAPEISNGAVLFLSVAAPPEEPPDCETNPDPLLCPGEEPEEPDCRPTRKCPPNQVCPLVVCKSPAG